MTDWSNKTNDELAAARENALAKLTDAAWAASAQQMLTHVEAEIARRNAEPSGLHPDTAAQIRNDTAHLGLAERVARAFIEHPPSEAEARAIRAVRNHPGSTSRELTAAAGWAGETTWHVNAPHG